MKQEVGMDGQAKNRVWVWLPDDEAAALEQAAAARGCRTSDLVRAAVVAFLKAPPDVGQSAPPGIDPAALTRLEQLAGRLEALTKTAESHTMSTRLALDLAFGAERDRNRVYDALSDISLSIGVLAGNPMTIDADAPEGTPGIRREGWEKNFG